MKKILISCICFISLFVFTGCANTGDAQTITSLKNQLDRIENIVSSTSTAEIADVSPYVTLESNEPYNSIQSLRALSNENMLREEEIRQKTLSINAQLKAKTNTKYKLGRKKNNALKDITSNLSKYVTHLNATKPQIKSSVSKIKRNLKVTNINIEEATSSYSTLNSSMNERYAYLCNIYNNLEQACIILNCYSCDNCQNNNLEASNKKEISIDDNQAVLNEDQKQEGSFKIVKNIDSFDNSPENNDYTENLNDHTENKSENFSTYPKPPYPNQPIPRPIPHSYPNFYGNYIGGYGNYSFYGNRMNPNRNTDTFYSFNRNIDTYRYNPNFNNYYYAY